MAVVYSDAANSMTRWNQTEIVFFIIASIAMYKTEMLADQLRLRMALELLLNPDFYSLHPLVMKMQDNLTTLSGSKWSKEGLCNTTTFSDHA